MNAGLFTNLQEFVESEFLYRELGLTFEYIPDHSISNVKNVKGIVTEDLSKWNSVLSNAAKSSIVVFLTGNEFYKKEIFEQLNLYQSISVAFVQYLPDKSPKIPFKFLLHELIQDPPLLWKIQFWRTLRRALRTFLHLRGLSLKVQTHLLPLGYTNRFIGELALAGLIAEGESLLLDSRVRIETRNESIFFTGQKGSWLRRRLIDKFQSEKEARIKTYDGWGGGEKAKSTEYTNSLLIHKYCLCPPGNLCNDTPRYYEAVSLGSLPILSRVSLQDWNDFGHWPAMYCGRFQNETSYAIYKKVTKMSIGERDDLLSGVISFEIEKIKKLRELIWMALYDSQKGM